MLHSQRSSAARLDGAPVATARGSVDEGSANDVAEGGSWTAEACEDEDISCTERRRSRDSRAKRASSSATGLLELELVLVLAGEQQRHGPGGHKREVRESRG